MCLACEMDALWYAEWERLAAQGAAASATVGVTPAVPEEADGAEVARATEQAAGAAASPRRESGDAADGVRDARPAPLSRFFCEET
jgi:hypothetical protein